MTTTQTQPQTPADITEAYKAVIDFNKVVISISSAILAALISYLVSQDFSFAPRNFASPIVLTISIACSLLGFGRAIGAINKKEPRINAVKFSNVAGGAMLLGILSIGFIKKNEEKKIDDILKEIDKTSSILEYKLQPANCTGFDLREKTYVLHYAYDTIAVQVDYSLEKSKILSLNKTIIPAPKKQIIYIEKKKVKRRKKDCH